MAVDADIYQTLTTSVTLTALTTAIYPEHGWQEDQAPAVVYYRAPGGERIHDLKGYAGKELVPVEIAAYTTAVDARRVLADAVISAMTGSTRFTCRMAAPPFDDYDPDTKIYERTMLFDVWNTT